MSIARTVEETRAELAALYEERRGSMLGWARAATRDAEEAEDLLQAAFLGALDHLDLLSAVENLGAWLFASLRNRVVDRWRKNRRREALGETRVSDEFLEEVAQAAGLEPQAALEEAELRSALAEAIEALPAAQREVVLAQVLGGESFREIAERTGLSADTLASRKRYAIKALAAALEDWMEI